MRICRNEMRMGVLSLAVSSALAVMFATPMTVYAEESWEDEVAAIRHPTNYIELGAENVSKDSAKFGEYNGLNKSGGKAIANFSVRGGDAYEGGDGTMRWSLTGRDLGTTSRELGAAVGNQGRWNLNIGYDELRHNITDTYQTPQQGTMGGNVFTLPASFEAFNAQSATSARVLTANQLAAFHTEDVGSTRKNTSMGAGINLSPELSLKFDYNHLAQSGAKLIAGSARGNETVPGTATTWRAEAVAMLMNPTNYKTDTFNLSLNWVGESGHLSGGYFGSFFKDGYDRLSYENPMMTADATPAPGVFQTTTLSTAPDNQLHQFNLSGGYAFSPATKLVGGISYGRNTQNSAFLTGMPETVLAPEASLNGVVVTKHADAKLTNKTTQELTLSASLKYNERDNRSASNVYQYLALNNATTDSAANAPYSNKKTELGLAGDYRLDKSQTIRLAYDLEKITRQCGNYALASNCLVDTANTENKLGVKYRVKASSDLGLSVAYSIAKRKGTYDNNAITPLGGLNVTPPTLVNSQNYDGFVAVPYAERTQNMLKAGADWQAGEKLEFSAEGRYANNKYDSTYGVKDGKTWGVNLDATYRYSEDGSVSTYLSQTRREQSMTIKQNNAAVTATAAVIGVPANSNWTNDLKEDGVTLGLNVKQSGLMAGKLELGGDLTYSLDKTGYATTQNYAGTTTGGWTCDNPNLLTCGVLPDIRSRLITFKVTGIYSLDQASKVSVGYMFQQLKSDDYAYNAFQYGYTSSRLMPTNQTPGSYAVNVIGATYIYSFK